MEIIGKMGLGKGKETGKGGKKQVVSNGWDNSDIDAGQGGGLSGDLDFNDLEIQFDDSK